MQNDILEAMLNKVELLSVGQEGIAIVAIEKMVTNSSKTGDKSQTIQVASQ